MPVYVTCLRIAVALSFMMTFALPAQQPPKIGLTLSGGGAKGLSHIGILKAIDSAGLNIDMITGTSMGSIIGSLYAAGYSGAQIETIARKLDWSKIFSSSPEYKRIAVNAKKEFDSYIVEVPFEKGKVKISTGVIEGEEIWLTFGELFTPMYRVKDFSKFSIPFQCIATDLSTGKPVVLSSGEIVKAIRASMAIPSIFTAIDYGDTRLVDGGVVENFPVTQAKAMGADYVIGVNLSAGLVKASALNSPVEVMLQIGFYKDADNFSTQKKLCNLLIEPALDGYSAGSFGSVDTLLAIGNRTGKQFYPQFKRLADSLKANYPGYRFRGNRLPESNKVIIDDILVQGLVNFSRKSFVRELGLQAGSAYTGGEIAEAIRTVMSSRKFKRVAFFLSPNARGNAVLNLEVIENPLTFAKVALHYHTYSDIALITTLSMRAYLGKRSTSMVKINWSKNFRALVEHDQPFGSAQKFGVLASLYHERFKLPLYSDFEQVALYRNIYSTVNLRGYYLPHRNTMLGIGNQWEYFNIKPDVSFFTIEGRNSFLNTYLFLSRNTHDEKYFPTEGASIDLQGGIIYSQDTNFEFSDLTTGGTLQFKPYQYVRLKSSVYAPAGKRGTVFTQLNAGINLNYKEEYLNFYAIGGITDFIRNQFPFVGLRESEGTDGSVATLLLGWRYEVLPSVFGTVRANVGLYDFIDKAPSSWTARSNVLSGYGLSAGYRSAIGPIEFSFIYSDQTQNFSGYINLGYYF